MKTLFLFLCVLALALFRKEIAKQVEKIIKR